MEIPKFDVDDEEKMAFYDTIVETRDKFFQDNPHRSLSIYIQESLAKISFENTMRCKIAKNLEGIRYATRIMMKFIVRMEGRYYLTRIDNFIEWIKYLTLGCYVYQDYLTEDEIIDECKRFMDSHAERNPSLSWSSAWMKRDGYGCYEGMLGADKAQMYRTHFYSGVRLLAANAVKKAETWAIWERYSKSETYSNFLEWLPEEVLSDIIDKRDLTVNKYGNFTTPIIMKRKSEYSGLFFPPGGRRKKRDSST